jgi:hypothetical protein
MSGFMQAVEGPHTDKKDKTDKDCRYIAEMAERFAQYRSIEL